MRRTEEKALIIETFGGVNNLVDEITLPPQLSPWVHGCFADERGHMVRIPGKVLVSSNASSGVVLSITQLTFAERGGVVVHQSSKWIFHSDITQLTTDTDITPDSVLEPIIL